MNIELPWKMPRATEHIQEQIDLIKKIEKNGYTYKTSDGIYFDTSRSVPIATENRTRAFAVLPCVYVGGI